MLKLEEKHNSTTADLNFKTKLHGAALSATNFAEQIMDHTNTTRARRPSGLIFAGAEAHPS